MPSHGLTGCARVYRIPDGTKYLVIGDSGDYRNGELLQLLQGTAVQLLVDGDREQVYIWWPSMPTEP